MAVTPAVQDRPLRELRGVVERITYQNPENGYTVARLAPERPESVAGAGAPVAASLAHCWVDGDRGGLTAVVGPVGPRAAGGTDRRLGPSLRATGGGCPSRRPDDATTGSTSGAFGDQRACVW